MANANKQGLRLGIINADDPNADWFARDIDNLMLYGMEHGDIRATDVQLSPKGASYTATINGQDYHIAKPLPGSFNVYNSSAAACAGRSCGFDARQVQRGIAAPESVEGRMTRIEQGQPFDVIVDYAHSPDSFEKLFADLKPSVKGKLDCHVWSLGGGDSQAPIAGELAGKYADLVILTEKMTAMSHGNKS